MPPKMRSGKAVWIVVAAVIVAALLLITLFVTQTRPDRHESIVLPSAPSDNPDSSEQGSDVNAEQDDFVVLTNENAATVLQTLNRPAAYHQCYTVTVGSDSQQRTKAVELWVNGDLLHAEVTDGSQKQTLITNGTTVYLWYEDGRNPISIEIPQGMTAADILGLPNFDAYLTIPQDAVTEADYLLLEEPQVQCVYVSVQETDTLLSRYWVNLENGLLYQADAMSGNNRVYSILQTGFDALAAEDEGFSNRFVLPDGSTPFTEETEMPQP